MEALGGDLELVDVAEQLGELVGEVAVLIPSEKATNRSLKGGLAPAGARVSVMRSKKLTESALAKLGPVALDPTGTAMIVHVDDGRFPRVAMPDKSNHPQDDSPLNQANNQAPVGKDESEKGCKVSEEPNDQEKYTEDPGIDEKQQQLDNVPPGWIGSPGIVLSGRVEGKRVGLFVIWTSMPSRVVSCRPTTALGTPFPGTTAILLDLGIRRTGSLLLPV